MSTYEQDGSKVGATGERENGVTSMLHTSLSTALVKN